MSARFSFTGKLEVNVDPEAKNYFLRTGKTSGKNNYKSINLQVLQDKNNRAFVEMFGMQSDIIKTIDTENNKIDIGWNDRFDDDVIKQVANYKKTTIKNGDERNDFISSYDAIEYFVDHIDDFKDKVVTVTGQRTKNLYQNKLTDRFQITSIRTVNEDDEVTKKLSVSMDFFFNKDSFDTSDWSKEHKLYINGYTSEYIGDLKENKYVAQQIVFDCGKIDWENDKHRALVNYRLKIMGCELTDDNKIVCKLKGKNMFAMGIVTTYVNGSEKLDFDESMLTDMQKEAIELGIKTIDDFRPVGSIYGTRVVIYKLKDFVMQKDSKYEDGYIDTDISVKEFEDNIWVTVEDVSVDDIENDTEDVTSDAQSDEDDDDLFG